MERLNPCYLHDVKQLEMNENEVRKVTAVLGKNVSETNGGRKVSVQLND